MSLGVKAVVLSSFRAPSIRRTGALPAWRLPRTFEPYYFSRVLRGTPQGLSLFLVQAIARSHGGRALARWEPDGSVSLRIELPS